MTQLRRTVLLCLGILLFSSMHLEAKENKVKLEKGEKKFRNIKSYTLRDFNFNWHISYMDIVVFQTNESDGKDFTLPSKVKFYNRIKVGKDVSFPYKKQLWLAKAILKPSYFWKSLMSPSALYSFTSMRFLEKGDKRFKAITELKDIQDMFGDIDTEAELRMWIMATKPYAVGIYSYKKTEKGYRVRFAGTGLGCYYKEYFNYYDKRGKLLKTKQLKWYRVKNCSPILL